MPNKKDDTPRWKRYQLNKLSSHTCVRPGCWEKAVKGKTYCAWHSSSLNRGKSKPQPVREKRRGRNAEGY